MKYIVAIKQTVSTAVEVTANSVEEALDTFHESPEMPGGITHQAFGSGASVDEAGEWEPVEVLDDQNVSVWEAEPIDQLPIGTVLGAGDPEPPDGTILMLTNDTYERYDSSLIGGSWALFANKYGPFVVGPDVDKLLRDAEQGK